MWERCRYCGSTAERARVLADGDRTCPRCAGSPLCDRCGHPRDDHTGVFTTLGRSCGLTWVDIQSLSKLACDCVGFAPVTTALRDATFAEVTPERPLRVAGRVPARGPSQSGT